MEISTTVVGAVVGRFQSPHLHEGHKALLDFVHSRHSRVLVFVGVRPITRNQRHPLSFEIRRQMITKHYPRAIVLPLSDQGSNDLWSKELDKSVRTAVGMSNVVFYTGRDGFGPHYTGSYPVKEINFPTEEEVSSTEIREKIPGWSIDSEEFRSGVIYDVYNTGPVVENTVDVIAWRMLAHDPAADMLDEDSLRGRLSRVQVLLGKKTWSDKFVMPGGFVDPAERYEMCALRELREETGVSGDLESIEYVCSGIVDDWRTSDCDQHFIRTSVFLVHIPWGGRVKANDDLDHAEWVNLTTLIYEENSPDSTLYLERDLIADHHEDLVESAIRKLAKLLKRF